MSFDRPQRGRRDEEKGKMDDAISWEKREWRRLERVAENGPGVGGAGVGVGEGVECGRKSGEGGDIPPRPKL